MERKGTAEVADCNVTWEVRPGYLGEIGQIVHSKFKEVAVVIGGENILAVI